MNLEKKVCIMSNEIEMNISINVTMCPRPERNTGVPEGLKTWWGQYLKCTGKYLSEVQYVKISSSKHGENMLCTEIDFCKGSLQS